MMQNFTRETSIRLKYKIHKILSECKLDYCESKITITGNKDESEFSSGHFWQIAQMAEKYVVLHKSCPDR